MHPNALTWKAVIEPGWVEADLVLYTQIDGGMGRRLTTEADLNALGFFKKPSEPSKPQKPRKSKENT